VIVSLESSAPYTSAKCALISRSSDPSPTTTAPPHQDPPGAAAAYRQ
jgi:hypothetical protein